MRKKISYVIVVAAAATQLVSRGLLQTTPHLQSRRGRLRFTRRSTSNRMHLLLSPTRRLTLARPLPGIASHRQRTSNTRADQRGRARPRTHRAYIPTRSDRSLFPT